jgi:hypothetical protein
VISRTRSSSRCLATFDCGRRAGARNPFGNIAAQDFGSQSNVSEVLNGKREINARQARSLAKRFGVSPAVFI